MSNAFDTNLQFLSGVGPRRALLLEKELGMGTVGDLLSCYPFRYIDRSRFYAIRELHPDLGYVQIRGHFSSMSVQGQGPKKRLTALFTDGLGEIEVVFFQGIKWVQAKIMTGVEYVLFGKVSVFNQSLNMVHPEVEQPFGAPLHGTASMQALYPGTEKLRNNGINQKFFSRLMAEALAKMKGQVSETLPSGLIQSLKLISKAEALANIHFPANKVLLAKAQQRLKFEELFYIQLDLLKQKSLRLSSLRGLRLVKIGEHFNNCYHKLPFSLTNAQKRALKEIRQDTGSGKQMNRLLQGDVGSGKTMVALLSVLIAIDNGFQACMMAPTEILARQHFASISKLTAGGSTTVGLLTGSTKRSERKKLFQALADGSLHLLVGTHALIEEQVQFANLGFVVIDEQHRFGVDQRARLWSKNQAPPHILVMTATPIPRTLAMTLYGDLDVSVIDELPPGRQPVKSLHFNDSQRLRVFGFMKEQIKTGRQVYVVYPLIKESEKMDYQNLEEGYEHVSRAFPLPDYFTSVVHGQQKSEDKAFEMNRFIEGKTHIMVATSVIEVGVDVPNASVMVIESAERFGLSQLHQLRGRVGRGAAQSYCIFMTGHKLTKEARQRIELLCASNDGFEIAEADLKLRGPGDLEGTRQSGIAFELKIADLAKDGQLLELARKTAIQVLAQDSLLQQAQNSILAAELQRLHKEVTDYSRIS
ncbi:MAG: ATP-dependent DNA helicase RecG [Bacteroidales bacterium]|nr:ATP-dependent DNA helicase RecG [Bacteroidales bacterium]MCL2738017.1 ATP-dependent DNA helicase RecG [Bacteroidales bacterium]